jgi:branched-chain amino acid aminotransferase
MASENFLFYNNRFYKSSSPLLVAGNRAFRYGEGLFETLKVVKGQIVFAASHFTRLQNGLNAMQLPQPAWFTGDFITEKITALLHKNSLTHAARVRLTVWRGNGGLYEVTPGAFDFCIECFPLEQAPYTFNENGLVTGIFEAARKTDDAISNYKTANHLVYALAAVQAKNNRHNDCFVLNIHGRLCDSTIANIFIVKNNIITTPPLTEGCIDGVLRRYLLDQLPGQGFTVTEAPITIEAAMAANEIFVTNVIKGIRWIKELNGREYTQQTAGHIHSQLLANING